MTSAARPPRSFSRNCLGCLIELLVGVPLLVAAAFALDAFVAAPWAYPVLGRPTLTATWLGEFTVPSGLHFALFLDLRHNFLTDGDPESDGLVALLTGQAAWCDNHARRADHILLDGHAPNLAGLDGTAKDVVVDLHSADAPLPGLQPAYSKGSWSRDRLSLTFDLIFYDPQTKGLVSSTNDPDTNATPTVVFTKADDAAFQAACARLAGGA